MYFSNRVAAAVMPVLHSTECVLTHESARAPIPYGCRIQLWPHQLAMLNACVLQEFSRRTSGIMCDRPGSGKTNVILALALITARHESMNQSRMNQARTHTHTRARTRTRSTIVVVPHNILTQWRDAAIAFAQPGMLSVGVIDSYPPVAQMLHNPAAVLYAHDIIITTSLYFNTIAGALHGSRMMAHRLVFDEVDSMNGLMSSAFPAEFTWFVSATAVENFVNISTRANNKYTSAAACAVRIQCDAAFIDACVPLPEPARYSAVIANVLVDEVLSGVLSHREIGALNAMCYDHVMLQNGAKFVARSDAEAVRMLLEDSFAVSVKARKREKELGGILVGILEQELKDVIKLAEQHEDRIAIITRRLADNDCCIICYETFKTVAGDRMITKCCKNAFCEPCMNNWMARSSTCPTCRAPINGDRLVVIRASSSTAPSTSSTAPSTPVAPVSSSSCHLTTDADIAGAMNSSANKIAALKVLLEARMQASPDSMRIIVFSDYQGTFKPVVAMLRQLGLAHTELDGGNVSALDAAQRDFRLGHAKILLVNSEFYGAGMNLECAKDVVFMHLMTPHMEKQVVGRAQRPGRTCQLAVWSLMFNNEARAQRSRTAAAAAAAANRVTPRPVNNDLYSLIPRRL